MQDISKNLSKIIKDKQCSALLAFIVAKDGLYIQESKPNEKSGRRLRDTRNRNTDR